MSCGVGHRCGSDPELLQLWLWPAATALIQTPSLGTSICRGNSPRKWQKDKKKKKKKRKFQGVFLCQYCFFLNNLIFHCQTFRIIQYFLIISNAEIIILVHTSVYTCLIVQCGYLLHVGRWYAHIQCGHTYLLNTCLLRGQDVWYMYA